MEKLYRTYARLLARPSLYRANRLLYNFAIRGMGILNYQTDELSGETGIVSRFIGSAPEGAVVVDVGANEGNWSASALKANPSINLYAFEPVPSTFARLSERIKGNCICAAVGANAGEATIYDYAGAEGTSHASLHPNVIERFHGQAATSQTVPLVTLSDKIPGNHIHFLKIDVEGYELEVLKGLRGFFERGGKVDAVQVEFNEMNIISRTFVDDLLAFFPQYRVYRILPKGRTVDVTNERPSVRDIFAYQNLLFTGGVSS